MRGHKVSTRGWLWSSVHPPNNFFTSFFFLFLPTFFFLPDGDILLVYLGPTEKRRKFMLLGKKMTLTENLTMFYSTFFVINIWALFVIEFRLRSLRRPKAFQTISRNKVLNGPAYCQPYKHYFEYCACVGWSIFGLRNGTVWYCTHTLTHKT